MVIIALAESSEAPALQQHAAHETVGQVELAPAHTDVQETDVVVSFRFHALEFDSGLPRVRHPFRKYPLPLVGGGSSLLARPLLADQLEALLHSSRVDMSSLAARRLKRPVKLPPP